MHYVKCLRPQSHSADTAMSDPAPSLSGPDTPRSSQRECWESKHNTQWRGSLVHRTRSLVCRNGRVFYRQGKRLNQLRKSVSGSASSIYSHRSWSVTYSTLILKDNEDNREGYERGYLARDTSKTLWYRLLYRRSFFGEL